MMKGKKKLVHRLVVAAMLFGMGVAASTARANCLIPMTWSDGTTGFISCGSSAGTYVAHRTASGWESYDGGFFDEVLCAIAC